MSAFSTTQQPDDWLLYVVLGFSLVISLSYLSYILITKCCTLRPSPISALPPACRHLKPAQFPSSSVGTSTTNQTLTSGDHSQYTEEPSETTHLLDRSVTASTKSLPSFHDNTLNNQLYSFAFSPGNALGMDSSCDDCRYAENHSGYGTTNPEGPSHTVVAVGMDVPPATAHSKREDLGGYDGSVKFVGSVWSTTSSIGVNENRLYDHLLRCPDSCDWREELKQRKEEWEDRNRLLAQYAKQ